MIDLCILGTVTFSRTGGFLLDGWLVEHRISLPEYFISPKRTPPGSLLLPASRLDQPKREFLKREFRFSWRMGESIRQKRQKRHWREPLEGRWGGGVETR